jgi:hypothetical protein
MEMVADAMLSRECRFGNFQLVYSERILIVPNG